MKVLFRSRRLLRCYEESAQAAKEWGPAVGRAYIKRVAVLRSMEAFSEIFAQPSWRAHPLRGRREGQYAIALNDRWRLIVREEEDGDAVTVEEVTNHYGD